MNHIPGEKFKRLTLVSGISGSRGKWNCVCDCGKSTVKRITDMTKGRSGSCGCLHKEAMGKFNRSKSTHKMSGTPTFVSWSSMMKRCLSPKEQKWKDYGAKGIVPCSFLQQSPLNLVASIGKRPEGTSIDRIKNNLGYYCGECDQCKANGWPKNIRWSTATEQCRNKTDNHLLTIKGEAKTLTEWSEKLGIFRLTLAYRQKQGWSDERIVQKPTHK